jgi:hypothetical protein
MEAWVSYLLILRHIPALFQTLLGNSHTEAAAILKCRSKGFGPDPNPSVGHSRHPGPTATSWARPLGKPRHRGTAESNTLILVNG